jgi:hypothetical protein
MKYFAFALCLFIAFANCMASIWEHNLTLSGAWAFAFFGWLSCLFTNLSLDEERK